MPDRTIMTALILIACGIAAYAISRPIIAVLRRIGILNP
jgi:hypothetical protein